MVNFHKENISHNQFHVLSRGNHKLGLLIARPDRRGVKPELACARSVARSDLHADVFESSPVGIRVECAQSVSQSSFA